MSLCFYIILVLIQTTVQVKRLGGEMTRFLKPAELPLNQTAVFLSESVNEAGYGSIIF